MKLKLCSLVTRNHYKIREITLKKLREITPLFSKIEVFPITRNPTKLHEKKLFCETTRNFASVNNLLRWKLYRI